MNLKHWVRHQITKILGRWGYVLTRSTVSGTGWEPALQTALRSDPERRPLVLDIGANQGGFCEMVILQCPNVDIYAFEPLPEMIRKLEAISPGIHRLVISPLALGAAAGQATFNVHTHVDSSSLLPAHPDYKRLYPAQSAVANQIDVRVETLDQWAKQNGLMGAPVDLVKMDVQGYEGHVISGGSQVLRSTRFLIVEAALYPLYEGGILIDELSEKLRELDFELVWGFNVCGAFCDLFWRNRSPNKT